MDLIFSYIKSLYNEDKEFLLACRKGNIKFVRSYHYYLEDYSRDLENEGFLQACNNKQLEIAKFLFSFGRIQSYYSSTALCFACSKGNIDIVKWLYSIGITNIYYQMDGLIIEDKDYEIFSIACVDGNLDIAQWIYSLGNIRIGKDSQLPKDITFAQMVMYLGNTNFRTRKDYIFKNSPLFILNWLKTL